VIVILREKKGQDLPAALLDRSDFLVNFFDQIVICRNVTAKGPQPSHVKATIEALF
jgi:hypothetical protein